MEAFRDRWPYAFPWGRLAMSQAQAPTVRWVAFGGPPLLTFLVALAGTTLAWLLLARGRSPARSRRAEAPAARRRAAPRCAVAIPAARLRRRRRPRPGRAGCCPSGQPAPAPPTAEVAAVQGNVPHSRTLQKLLRETTVTENHAAATEQLAAQVRAGRGPRPTW